ncbi:MAG: GTP cyclohydrolase II [Acidobacteriota bacterium]|nr:GTP cyclohydrolase II [Blastocatellia bacterium]MDW8412668.1 GTP cyclohydrolase II [Acidobacteriota bacterium]
MSTKLVAQAHLPTELGQFQIAAFKTAQGKELVALLKGKFPASGPTLVRIHSQCLTGDVFYSVKCDCGKQLKAAMEIIESVGQGVIIYQPEEGRGIGIVNKIRAYELQDRGADTVEANLMLGFGADERSYEECAEILKLLGVTEVRLISNNPGKIASLESAGLRVIERVPIEVTLQSVSAQEYMKAKKEKLGHLIS